MLVYQISFGYKYTKLCTCGIFKCVFSSLLQQYDHMYYISKTTLNFLFTINKTGSTKSHKIMVFWTQGKLFRGSKYHMIPVIWYFGPKDTIRGLSRPHFCACPMIGHGFPKPYADHHGLNFLFRNVQQHPFQNLTYKDFIVDFDWSRSIEALNQK